MPAEILRLSRNDDSVGGKLGGGEPRNRYNYF